MRYGRHAVATYEQDFPDDPRVAEAKTKLAELEKSSWPEDTYSNPLDRRRAVEQAYDNATDPYVAAKDDERERHDRREEFVDIRIAEIKQKHHEAINAQPDHDLKRGGAVARDEAVADFEKQVKENKHPELNARIQDLTERQAARQEYITNHLAGPACEAKLKELGLDNVQEPEKEEAHDNNSRQSREDQIRAAYAQAGKPRDDGPEGKNKDHLPEY